MMKTPLPEWQPPAFLNRLIESRTLAAGNVQRKVVARIDWNTLPAEAMALAQDILNTRQGRAALPAVVGFEFDSRRLAAQDWLGRLTVSEFMRRQGARTLVFAAVPYQSRPHWDIYALETATLAILNKLCTESDALNHLVHSGIDRVLWSPRLKDSRFPDSWYLLEYSRVQSQGVQRRWFQESSVQVEQESAVRRQLLLESAGVEDALPHLRSRVADLQRILVEAWHQYVVTPQSAT